jgi:hypothetical protein
MLVTLLVLAPFGLALAVLSFPASRRSRVASAAGRPAVPPQAHRTVRGTAVQRAQVQPRGEMTGPFAYDNGLTIGAAEEAGEP